VFRRNPVVAARDSLAQGPGFPGILRERQKLRQHLCPPRLRSVPPTGSAHDMLRRIALVLPACLALVLSTLAISGSPRRVTVLESRFDQSTLTSLASVGTMVVTSGGDRFSLQPDPAEPNGRVGSFDDRGTLGESRIILEGSLENGAVVSAGLADARWDLYSHQIDAAFEVRVVVDNPSSDIYPISGQDESGDLTVGGVSTGFALPANSSSKFRVMFVRSSRAVDWSYAVRVTYDATFSGVNGGLPVPSTVSSVFKGTLPNSAGLSLRALEFEKPIGSTGAFDLDDVSFEVGQ